MKRTITQIAIVPEFNEAREGPFVIALADDGTLWYGKEDGDLAAEQHNATVASVLAALATLETPR